MWNGLLFMKRIQTQIQTLTHMHTRASYDNGMEHRPFIWNCNHPHTYALINRLYTITTHGNIVVFHLEHMGKKGFSNNLTGIKGNDKAKHIISRLRRLDILDPSFHFVLFIFKRKWMNAKGITICMYMYMVYTEQQNMFTLCVWFEYTKLDRKKSCVFFDDKKNAWHQGKMKLSKQKRTRKKRTKIAKKTACVSLDCCSLGWYIECTVRVFCIFVF